MYFILLFFFRLFFTLLFLPFRILRQHSRTAAR
jgi:hypothetical protein